jgi:hypothetical protein
MPARRKSARAKPAPRWPIVLPLLGVLLAAGCGVASFLSGSHAAGLPFLFVIPVAGLMLLGLPLLSGMLLLTAANHDLPWRTALLGVALGALSLGAIACVIALFGAGFRGYVAPRATSAQLRAAAADLTQQHAGEDRAVLTSAQIRSGPDTAALVQRLRPQSIVVDRGGPKVEPTVYFQWGASLYDWGIEVKGKRVEYRYGTRETLGS